MPPPKKRSDGRSRFRVLFPVLFLPFFARASRRGCDLCLCSKRTRGKRRTAVLKGAGKSRDGFFFPFLRRWFAGVGGGIARLRLECLCSRRLLCGCAWRRRAYDRASERREKNGAREGERDAAERTMKKAGEREAGGRRKGWPFRRSSVRAVVRPLLVLLSSLSSPSFSLTCPAAATARAARPRLRAAAKIRRKTAHISPAFSVSLSF